MGLFKEVLEDLSTLTCLMGNHTWVGCTCKKCGEIRDTDHRWQSFKNWKNEEVTKCTICGKIKQPSSERDRRRQAVLSRVGNGELSFAEALEQLDNPGAPAAKPAAPQQPVRQQPVRSTTQKQPAKQPPSVLPKPKPTKTSDEDEYWLSYGQSSAEEDLADSINAEFGPGGLRDRLNDELLKANLRSQLWASINDY